MTCMEDKIFIQVIKFEDLMNFVKQATNIGLMTRYQMPERAVGYTEDLSNLTEKLIEYSGNEQWRIKKEHNVPVKTNEGGIEFGNGVSLVDADVVYAMVDINSFIIVPGEKSVSGGGFNASEVLQIGNLIAVKPLLMTLVKYPVDEERGVWALDAKYNG